MADTEGFVAPRRSDPQEQMVEDIAGFSKDPLKFVLYAFPWGEPGPLADESGPMDWQREIMGQIRDGLLTAHEAIQLATASGHGIGKSAIVSWLVLWSLCTHEDTRGIVTAGTEGQLRTKTVPEVGKWFRLLICRDWFTFTTTAIYSNAPGHDKTWRIDFIPWSETNPEAFAGLHNKGKRILVVFDEGSQIADIIWETIEGALTDADTEIIWAVFGNPTRNTGRFRECFGRFKHRWLPRQIDARQVPITNKNQIQQWIDDYGEDSDFVRVRVRGVFPRAGSNQLISAEAVRHARERKHQTQKTPVIMGVDIARFGDDQTVIAVREGDKLFPLVKRREMDLMDVAGLVGQEVAKWRPDAVFIDEVGIGAGVVDRLRQLGVRCFGINVGRTASESQTYKNVRAEMWARMGVWLERQGMIPFDDPELEADLIGVEYGFDAMNRIQLEKKEDMKKRGLSSPDCGDALALTFSQHVVSHEVQAARRRLAQHEDAMAGYDPLG